MPADKDFKRLVRARMGKTGESYTTARAHLRPDGDPGARADLLADLRGQVLHLASAEGAAAAALRAAVPATR